MQDLGRAHERRSGDRTSGLLDWLEIDGQTLCGRIPDIRTAIAKGMADYEHAMSQPASAGSPLANKSKTQ
jgi:hypothetical protein